MRLGADPEQLRELSAALRAAARTLDQLGPGTERRIRAAGWHGPDALRFDGTWRRCRRDLDDAAGRCREMSARIEAFVLAIEDLTTCFEHAEHHAGAPHEHAKTYRDKVIPAMQKVREIADSLETMVDDGEWPLPKYREMLFLQ